MDRTLTAFARGSLVSSRFLVGYKEPYLLGRRLELYVTGFREEEDREGYDYVRGGMLLQTLFRFRGGRTLITRYTYQKTDTFNVEVPQDEVDRQFQDATISGPSVATSRSTTDATDCALRDQASRVRRAARLSEIPPGPGWSMSSRSPSMLALQAMSLLPQPRRTRSAPARSSVTTTWSTASSE